jgi:hypothetical protein
MTILPLLLNSTEFGFLVRRHPEVIRRKIRAREICANGRPAQIPSRELRKFGVDLDDAARVYAARFGTPDDKGRGMMPSSA